MLWCEKHRKGLLLGLRLRILCIVFYAKGEIMKRLLSVSLLAVFSVVLGACSGGDDVRKGSLLGFGQKIPDEFTVVTRAPLNMPPDFSLRPPREGDVPVAKVDSNEVSTIIWDKADKTQAVADGASIESQLLVASNAQDASDTIRQQLTKENTALALEKQSVADELIFGRVKPITGDKLDADGEQRRLQENKALGRDMLTGDSPITIKSKTTFSSLFDW